MMGEEEFMTDAEQDWGEDKDLDQNNPYVTTTTPVAI